MSSSVGRIGRIATLLLFAVVFGYPLLAFLSVAFYRDTGSGSTGPALGNATANWKAVLAFNDGAFLGWLTNSVIVASVGSLIAVIAALPAGYAIARLRFRGRRLLRFLTLLTMVIPNTVLVIPIYLEVSAVGAVNNLWVVGLLMGFFPFGVYLAYIHFKTTLPSQILESARLDGLTDIQTFFKIALPISKQAVALVAFFSFVANWTNFFLPLVLLPLSTSTTVSVGLQQLVSSSPLFDPTTAAGLDVRLYAPHLALATLVTTLPVLIVFVLAQRYLVRGQTLGAVKG
ncbi:sugar ABC transporter permease [Rhizocola hellebori]|uniref:Sugar ABC transporter permease n=1 Tax=Rhizocola hellebori TaxID=1392758 RepID=A0A8J3QHN7_9ACTN|nr:carbohydrate ABC transporter permease [Rhizocola hellebori]GIH09829.1 sugar ABC transporter permease [Rhizocola hellebori]